MERFLWFVVGDARVLEHGQHLPRKRPVRGMS
jgi:hypothetical protein